MNHILNIRKEKLKSELLTGLQKLVLAFCIFYYQK